MNGMALEDFEAVRAESVAGREVTIKWPDFAGMAAFIRARRDRKQ